MNTDESLVRFGLVPNDASLPAIRELLDNESRLEREGGEREEDLALLCAVQLFSRGNLEDVLRIWHAKTASFDLFCYLDIQFLCGAGLDATKAFLGSNLSPEAAKALEYIQKCESTGDFDGFDPGAYLEYYRTYFGVA